MNIGTITAILALKDQLSGQLETIKGSLTGFGTTVKSVAGLAAGAFAAIDFSATTDRLAKSASGVADAMDRMGVSAEAVQRLKFAAEQAGGSLSGIETAFKEMAKSLSGNDKAMGDTLERLGLSLGKLREMTPDQQFVALAEALRGVTDHTNQVNEALVVFGRSGMAILPAIKAGFVDVGAQAPVMSGATIAALDSMGDATQRLSGKMDALRAEALAPLASGFLAMPGWFQSGVAAVSAFMPSLEALILGVVALGGPGKALAALSAAFSSLGVWIAGAPALFASILPYLGIAGLVAAGVIGLVTVWKNWDTIKTYVQQTYTAIKEWMFDKLNAVWSSIKDKVSAVTGYFRDMYEAVVGHSYVPDMVRGIGESIDQLDDLFVNPAKAKTALVGIAFDTMASLAKSAVKSMVAGISESLGGVVGSTIPAFASSGASAMTSAGKSLQSGLMGALSAGLGDAIGALAGKAWDAIASAFAGGEEGRFVNPARDAFFAMFGGFEGLAERLTAASDGNIAEQLLAVLFNADSKAAFAAAKEAIEAVLEGAVPGMEAGTSPAQVAMDNLGASVTTFEALLTVATATTVTWAETFTGGIGTVQTAIERLIAAMERLNSIPIPSVPGAPAPSSGGPGFASGSGGLRDFGAGTVVTLHGREEVRTERQVQADTGVRDELRGLRADIRRRDQVLGMAIRDAVMVAR